MAVQPVDLDQSTSVVEQRTVPSANVDDGGEVAEFRKQFQEGLIDPLIERCNRLASSDSSQQDAINEVRKSVDVLRDALRIAEGNIKVMEARQATWPAPVIERCQSAIEKLQITVCSISSETRIQDVLVTSTVTEVKDIRSRNASLEAELRGAIKTFEKKIDESFDRQWQLPKVALTGLGLLALSGLAVGAMQTYYTFSSINRTVGKVEEKADSLDNDIETKVAELIDPKIQTAEMHAKTAHKDAEELHSLLNQQIALANAVHAALSSTNLGHQQLVYERNPHLARQYANEALKVLDRINLGATKASAQTLESVRADVLILKAQAQLELGDHASVAAVANELISIRPDGSEGHHFHGLALLLQAADEPNAERRQEITTRAIDGLKRALSISERRGNPDLLFLAIAEFDCDHFQAALDHAAEFVGDNHTEAAQSRNRLGTNVQGKISLATAWTTIAQYKLGREIESNNLQMPAFSAGAIRPEEGRILEAALTRIIARNPECPEKTDQASINCGNVRLYCERLLRQIRDCCGFRPDSLLLPVPVSTELREAAPTPRSDD
jgi:tetratricopeptide (TPR) repeat protein